MSLALNYWHFIVFILIILAFVVGIIGIMKQPVKKVRIMLIISLGLVLSVLFAFSFLAVDKYTKEVKLYKLKNKRLLSIEKIVYTGIVKNEGNHKIGNVTFEIKIVNKGNAAGDFKAGTFYEPSGFLDFFKGGSGFLYKPQSITKKYVVARNLKPGEAKSFRVHFDYPPYFKSVSHFAKVYGH